MKGCEFFKVVLRKAVESQKAVLSGQLLQDRLPDSFLNMGNKYF